MLASGLRNFRCVGVQKEISTDILSHTPFRYITMPVPQHIVLLYETVLPLRNIPKSTLRSSSRVKSVSEGWKNVGWCKWMGYLEAVNEYV
jgi:hypothetical protein